MSRYIKKQLQKDKHKKPTPGCNIPPRPKDEPPLADAAGTKQTQKVVGIILYYIPTVDLSVLMALSTITSEQAKVTKKTTANIEQVLGYLATNPDVTMRFHAPDMILIIHSDASYLSEKGTKSPSSDHFFLGWILKDD